MITLVLGGDKSGKSDCALNLLLALSGPKTMLATGEARDLAFRRQIADHRRTRPAEVRLVEARRLAEALDDERSRLARLPDPAGSGGLLVDSLDFWLFQAAGDEAARTAVLDRLERWPRSPDAPALVLVSAEVGLGPLAASAETRRFVRGLGAFNQAVARLADRVFFTVAGLPLAVKGS